MDELMSAGLTSIPGISVGHYTDPVGVTGCTVILCEEGAVGGVDVRGSAAGTREIEVLRPMSLVERIQALVISGGSVYGLDAATGVVRYLEERGIGRETTTGGKVPMVSAAILFDLGIGDPKARPGSQEGYRACVAANNGPIEEGSVGAGTGATVGKVLGIGSSTKGGLGSACQEMGSRLLVAALVVVNAVGDVLNPSNGRILAAPRDVVNNKFLSTMELLIEEGGRAARLSETAGTTIGVVATNARLTKEQTNKVAQMAQAGIARCVRPCYTMHDGDIIFALSMGDMSCDVDIVGSVGAEVVSQAIVRAIANAKALGGIPSARDFLGV
jgi:L-aminopeptidase/D-esterase-like protein